MRTEDNSINYSQDMYLELFGFVVIELSTAVCCTFYYSYNNTTTSSLIKVARHQILIHIMKSNTTQSLVRYLFPRCCVILLVKWPRCSEMPNHVSEADGWIVMKYFIYSLFRRPTRHLYKVLHWCSLWAWTNIPMPSTMQEFEHSIQSCFLNDYERTLEFWKETFFQSVHC